MPGQAIVSIGSKQWACTVANTYAELANGLSGVEGLSPNTGVLFDLGTTYGIIPIDMSGMLFPLDIIFIDNQSLVSAMFSGVQPGQTGVEGTNVRYFLEVNSGEAEGVGVGDEVTIEGLLVTPSVDLAQVMLLVVVMAMMGSMVSSLSKPASKQHRVKIGSPKHPLMADQASRMTGFLSDVVELGNEAYGRADKALAEGKPVDVRFYHYYDETVQKVERLADWVRTYQEDIGPRLVREYLPKAKEQLLVARHHMFQLDLAVSQGREEEAEDHLNEIGVAKDNLENLRDAAVIDAYEMLTEPKTKLRATGRT